MKKKLFSIIILSLLFSGVVFAQETELPDPGITPDSPFYFLETIIEEIATFFTLGDLKKAERYANLAAERLAEVKALAGKEKSNIIEKTLARYENQLKKSITRAEKAESKGKRAEKVMIKVGQATSRHLEILAEVYEKIPEQAKTAIENAMTASLKGHSRAVEVLKAKDALGELAEEVSLPKGISQEMKERIQTRAQQELEVEKTLESIDSSKSLRDICAEKGGTPEMCERFPLEKFESFAQIEAFCLEQGGPQEACASLEAKCKEFGVTDANECFIVLSTASITTYQSAELKTVPAIEATPIPEEVIEQRREQERTRIQEPVQIERAPIKTESEPPQISKPVISKVIIYTAQSCPHCQEAKQWLQANGISYEEFDVSENEEKQNELMEKAGQLAVPVIEAGSEIIIGFNESRLSELLGVN